MAAMIAAAATGLALAATPPAGRAPPAGDADPADRAALIAVCAACHPISLVEDSPRSEPDWIETVRTMVDRGAKGSDDQFDRIGRYLRLSLTTIDVNTAPWEDVADILGLDDAAAQAIVSRRAQAKFATLDDLAKVPGVDRAGLEARKTRIFF